MPNYILQDSGAVNWQLGITPFGQLTTTVTTGAVTTLYLVDSNGQTWQLGVTTNGQLTTTAVAANTPTFIELLDSNGFMWRVLVTTLGQLTANQESLIFPGDMTPGTCVMFKIV